MMLNSLAEKRSTKKIVCSSFKEFSSDSPNIPLQNGHWFDTPIKKGIPTESFQPIMKLFFDHSCNTTREDLRIDLAFTPPVRDYILGRIPSIDRVNYSYYKTMGRCPDLDPNMSPKDCLEHYAVLEYIEYFNRCAKLEKLLPKKTSDWYLPAELEEYFLRKGSSPLNSLAEHILEPQNSLPNPFRGFLRFPDSQSNYSFLNKNMLNEEYSQIGVFIVISVILALVIVLASYILITQTPESEKLSTYECGFEPYEDAKNKFDVQFYVVAILFVLFDIEIIVLLPWCLSLSNLNLLSYWSVIEFLLELGLGLIYVLCSGGLEWQKKVS